MQWSKLKQRIEGNFTPPLIGRISVTSTKYRKASNEHSRGTIKVDKDVWFDACAFKWNREWYKIFNENSEIDLGERYKYADQKLMDDNVLEGYDFNKRLFDYLNTSIEDALESNDIVHKILAILDKRVGKRRIKSLQDEYCENTILKPFVTTQHGYPLDSLHIIRGRKLVNKRCFYANLSTAIN